MRRNLYLAVLLSLSFACADPVTVSDAPIPDQIALSTATFGDTTLRLYLSPDQPLLPGDNSVFVHLGVSIRGTPLSSSSILARFSTNNKAILDVPYGSLLDDDRTRLFPITNGTATITAEWPVNGKTYRASTEYTVGAAGSVSSVADTVVQLYLNPDQGLVVGDNSVFVHARVLVAGNVLPASQTLATFTSANTAVISLPHGGLLDDDRTRVYPLANGKSVVTARWTANGKTYTGSREFTVGSDQSSTAADTTIQLYLNPEKALVVGDNSVFVHARVMIGGTALPASQTLTTFTSATTGVISLPYGGLADDDRTRVYPVGNGSSVVTARWVANGKTYAGTREFTVGSSTSEPAPAPDPEPSPTPAPDGSYSYTTPHWSHIRTRVTDFYYEQWTNARRDTAAMRFDLHMSGIRSEWTKRNASIAGIRYRLHWSIMQPAHAGSEYQQLLDWYKVNSSCTLEDAFLHKAGTSKTSSNRLTTTIWGSARWVFNPADACWRRWAIHKVGEARQQGWTGIFYDEYDPSLMSAAGAFNSLELGTADAFYSALRGALSGERAAYPGVMLVLNTAEYVGSQQAALIDAAGGAHLELFNDLLHGDMVGRWAFTEARLTQRAVVEFMGRRNWTSSLPASVTPGNYRDATLDGFPAPGMYRQKMGELASYYMIRPVDPSTFYFDTNNDNWKISPTAHWLKAQEVDVGSPSENRVLYVNTTGSDGQRVVIWRRHYTRALVLTRVTADWTNTGYGDGSAYRVPLSSAMRLLRHDGTLGPLVNEVWLRKGEAAIMMK